MWKAIAALLLALGVTVGIGRAGDKPRCVCEPGTKKVSHVVYNSRCEEYCGAHCGCLRKLWAWLGGACDCDCTCGKVRTRHVLLKRTVTEECPTVKCAVPPDCPPPACERRSAGRTHSTTP